MSDDPEQLTRSLRGVRGASFHLLTPDNRYGSELPDWPGAGVFKLATPRTGSARFGEYLLDLGPGGGTAGAVGAGFEHFLIVLGGATFALATDAGARLIWLKRRYEPLPSGERPPATVGRRAEVPMVPVPAPAPGVSRQELLAADDPRRDFTISVLRFEPGAALVNVEIHDEEHGLYMLQGAGLYHLQGAEYRVLAGDFIYMAPYCPQSFAATGEDPAEYLLYKDVFRDGFW